MADDTHGLHGAPDEYTTEGALGGPRLSPLSRHDGFWFSGKLTPSQRYGTKFLLNHPNAVLADDNGLGKTPVVLSYIARLEAAGELGRRGRSSSRVLWLTSPALIEQTRREIEHFLPMHSLVKGSDTNYRRRSRSAKQAWASAYGDLGPDILLMTYGDATTNVDGLTSRTSMPGLVVLDDANRASGYSGVRYKAVRRLTERAPRVVAMTATPLWNDPVDLYRLLRATGVPGLWPSGVFEREFVTWRHPNVAGPGRAQRVPDSWASGMAGEVRDFLGTCMIQRSVKDAGLSNPKRTGEHVRLVPLTPAQRQAYEQVAEQTMGREAVVKMGAIGRSMGYASPLVDACVDELRSLTGQVVVCSRAPEVRDLVEQELTAQGVSHVRVDKDGHWATRTAALDEFRAGGVQVLLGGEEVERGIDLSNCNDLLTLDPSWSPGEEYQREGRIRRPASGHRAFRHLALVPDHQLNRSKLRFLDRKWATATAVHLGRPEPRPSWAGAIPARELNA